LCEKFRTYRDQLYKDQLKPILEDRAASRPRCSAP